MELTSDQKGNLIDMEVLAEEEGVECEADVVVDLTCHWTNTGIRYNPRMHSGLRLLEEFDEVNRTEEWMSTQMGLEEMVEEDTRLEAMEEGDLMGLVEEDLE